MNEQRGARGTLRSFFRPPVSCWPLPQVLAHKQTSWVANEVRTGRRGGSVSEDSSGLMERQPHRY